MKELTKVQVVKSEIISPRSNGRELDVQSTTMYHAVLFGCFLGGMYLGTILLGNALTLPHVLVLSAMWLVFYVCKGAFSMKKNIIERSAHKVYPNLATMRKFSRVDYVIGGRQGIDKMNERTNEWEKHIDAARSSCGSFPIFFALLGWSQPKEILYPAQEVQETEPRLERLKQERRQKERKSLTRSERSLREIMDEVRPRDTLMVGTKQHRVTIAKGKVTFEELFTPNEGKSFDQALADLKEIDRLT